MGADISKIPRRRRDANASGLRSALKGLERGLINNNSNSNYMFGSGKINNHNPIYIDARPPAQPAPLLSDMSVSTTLPGKPNVFHGRDEFVDNTVQMLVGNATARLAILGSGGMGKTTAALALLHDPRVVERHRGGRLFLSCEALVDADAIVVSLAKILGLSASGDLLTAVVTHLAALARVILVLDNLETVWLSGGAPAAAVEELLGRLAQIPSLSLVITCRGTDMPRSVAWSNTESAALEPFSLEAALRTFQDRAGRLLAKEEEDMARQLLNAVDRMPLAVSLLGQLSRRGNSVSELLNRWNREHTMLLRTHGVGRINNVQVSIELSIKLLCEADDSREALQLLSLCCILPHGLRLDVFRLLRPQFKYIDRARDNLSAYALVGLGADTVLKALNPIRYLVLECHPVEQKLHKALCSIYFDIAQNLPTKLDEEYKNLAAAAAPEMNNLSSLLLTLVSQPSQQVVDAVIRLTDFAYLDHPTVTVASALLPHLEGHPEWKARCLKSIGSSQVRLGDYRPAIDSLTTATRLFIELGNWSEAAWCKRSAGEPHKLIGEYDHAERLLNEARIVYVELGDDFNEAMCRTDLGELMRMKDDYPTAIEHLSTARQTFTSLHNIFESADCSESLGLIYLEQDNPDSAATELEAARTAFFSLGSSHRVAQCTRLLSDVRREQGEFIIAEALLKEAEAFSKKTGDRHGLAECACNFGQLRRDQGRREEAIAQFQFALGLYEELQMNKAEICRKQIKQLQSLIVTTPNENTRSHTFRSDF